MATASQPLINEPFDLDATLRNFVVRELGPTPGRLEFAARTAITAALMLLIGEACHSQTLFVALFVPLLLPRDTPQQTWAGTKGTIIIVWCACAGAILLVLLTADLPGARVAALVFGIFVCMILSRGLHQPALAALGPVTVSEVLIRMDSVNSPEAAITAGLWMALMMSVGCLVATAVDFLYPHPGPRQIITKGIVDRLQTTAIALKQSEGTALSREEQQKLRALSKLVLAGTGSLRKLLPALVTQPSIDGNYMLRLSAILNGINLLCEQTLQLSKRDTARYNDEQKGFAGMLAHSCVTLADHVQRNVTTPREKEQAPNLAGNTPGHDGLGQLLSDIDRQLSDLWAVWSGDVTASKELADQIADKPAKAPPPPPGPFVTTDDVRFAVKVTLACMICYVIYNGVAWQGISTALVTCFFVADTTIGGTFRKLVLRISGVLVGGVLFGIGGIMLVTSHMDNVFELMLYVAMVFFIAGWVTKGSPRISYAGSQIAISYAFAAFSTPGITDEIVQPRDRLIGILLGTVVMWLVFTRLWPIDTQAQQRGLLASLIRKASELVLLAVNDSPPRGKSAKAGELRESINQSLTQVEDQADLSIYESKRRTIVQSALRKCIESTRELLALEWTQVDLSIRSAQDVAPEDLDRKDAQTTAEFLCLMAKQIEGAELPKGQLKDKESQVQAAQSQDANDSSHSGNEKFGPHQVAANANTHIRRRRNGLLENLFHAVEDATPSPH